jgi:hypothetical protein
MLNNEGPQTETCGMLDRAKRSGEGNRESNITVTVGQVTAICRQWKLSTSESRGVANHIKSTA